MRDVMKYMPFLAAALWAAPVEAEDKNGWNVGESAIAYQNEGVKLQFDGYLQYDAFLPLRPDNSQEDFDFRRIRPTLRGKLGEHTSFKLMSDLSDGRHELQDAYLTYKFNDTLAVTGGKLKVPMGIEVLQSSSDLHFIERSPVSSLLPSREHGAMLEWKPAAGWASQFGIFTHGTNDESPDGEDWRNHTYNLRVQYSPLEDWQLGIAGEIGNRHGDAKRKRLIGPESVAGGEMVDYLGTSIAEGNTWRITPQISYYHGPVGMMAEYAYISQGTDNTATGDHAHLNMHGGQVSISYLLTGEKATYGHLTPLNLFNPAAGQWGAWEIAARLAYLNAENVGDTRFINVNASADEMVAATFGINWHLNDHIKLMTNYEYAAFSTNLPEEQSIFTRIQLEY